MPSCLQNPFGGFQSRTVFATVQRMSRIKCFASILLLALSLSPAQSAEPTPNGGVDASGLKTYTNCTYVPTTWGDGDSFRVRFPDGSDHTLRLYGADCIEWHVNDQADARRLRDQRRYFGISGNTEDSVAIARDFGGRAATRTRALLSKPFTVHTAFADALGDQKFKRVYAFITIAEGGDLATILIAEGLARAHGVYRLGPANVPANEYREYLRDIELTAAKAGRGVWAHTDWERLPSQRQASRVEEAELSKSISKMTPTESTRIDPNTATLDELMVLPGVGEELARRIINGRANGPYRKPLDLDRVPGIGSKMIENLKPYLIFPSSFGQN